MPRSRAPPPLCSSVVRFLSYKGFREGERGPPSRYVFQEGRNCSTGNSENRRRGSGILHRFHCLVRKPLA